MTHQNLIFLRDQVLTVGVWVHLVYMESIQGRYYSEPSGWQW